MCEDCLRSPESSTISCSECGRSSDEVYISRYGYCDDCYERNHEGEYGYCEICGAALVGAEPSAYDGTRCFSCAKCDLCGDDIYDDYSYTGGYICLTCYNANSSPVYCSICGADCALGGGEVEGKCLDCYRTQPNVWCPDCGYGFFVTGVGIDGLDCPSCGKNFMPLSN